MKLLAGFVTLCLTVVAIAYIQQKSNTKSFFKNSSPLTQYIDVSGHHFETFSSDDISWELQLSLSGKEKNDLIQKKNARIQELTKLTSSLEINKDSLLFENYTLKKEWNWNSGKKVFVGYQLNQQIKVSLRSQEKSDYFSEGLTQINDIEVLNIKYDVSDKDEKKNQIAAQAFEKAKRKARTLAKASGQKLGPVISITEEPQQNEPLVFATYSKAGLLGGARAAIGENGPNKTTLEATTFVRFSVK